MKWIAEFPQWVKESEYRGLHRAPSGRYGGPLHDLSDFYPDDIYGPAAARIYGHGFSHEMDQKSINIMKAARGNPDYMVKIYRAIPSSVPEEKSGIFQGDWVTINKEYAIQHGESMLDGDYKIASMDVPAKHLYTDANSIHEWGYDPS